MYRVEQAVLECFEYSWRSSFKLHSLKIRVGTSTNTSSAIPAEAIVLLSRNRKKELSTWMNTVYVDECGMEHSLL